MYKTILVCLLISSAAQAKYSCSIAELKSDGIAARSHKIEFARLMSLETDYVGKYKISFSDYTGQSSISVVDSNGSSVLNSTVNSGNQMSVMGKDLIIKCTPISDN